MVDLLSSGSKELDRLLDGGYEKDTVTTIFGPAGAGKTVLCLLACVHVPPDKKIIYIDSDGGFSVERLKQMTPQYNDVLKQMVFLNPVNFDEQKRVFERLKKLVTDQVCLIVFDSVAHLYRLEVGKTKNAFDVNKELGVQISFLVEIARKKKIPILLTNQVYTDFEDREKVFMVGGDVIKYGSKCLLEVMRNEDGTRKLVVRKHRSIPDGKSLTFRIVNDGIEEVKK
jgi:DNA repair protein RadB